MPTHAFPTRRSAVLAVLLEGEFRVDARLLDVLLGLVLGCLQGASARDLQLAGFLLGGDAGAGSLGLAADLVAHDLGALGRTQGLERALLRKARALALALQVQGLLLGL